MELFEECKLLGDFTLSSGRQSSVFYDFDLLKPSETAAYVEQLVRLVPKDIVKKVNFIAAPALGGIVPGFLAAFATNKPLVIVDKEGNLRGPKVKGGHYLIWDDVITSFQAVKLVRNALPDAKCLGAVSYIFRGSRKDLAAQDIPAYYLARKEQEV